MTRNVARKLGCKFTENPFLTIKDIDHDVCIILDACHMLKLRRNTLADKKIIESGNEKKIQFKYIENLLSVQTKEDLKFGNKLSHTHAFYKNKIMSVKTVSYTHL